MIDMESTTSNPFASADATWIENFLGSACRGGLTPAEQSELDDQIEALVPALIELRDGGHINLSARSFVEYGSAAGFSQLAKDSRLSRLSQQRCEAIRVRMVVHGIRTFLGHV